MTLSTCEADAAFADLISLTRSGYARSSTR